MTPKDHSKVQPIRPAAHRKLELDQEAIDTVRSILDGNTLLPGDNADRQDIIQLLNDSLATELVCALRYKRHHFTASGLESPKIAEEFLVHANEETAHADRIARRIVQLGGSPDFAPDSLMARSHAAYDDSTDLRSMIQANLTAELVAIEAYGQMVTLIGNKDTSTRRLVEDILADEQEHADELKGWLADTSPA